MKKLQHTYDQEKAQMDNAKKALLKLANKQPEGKVERLLNSIRLLGRKQKPIKFKALVSLFLLGDVQQFKKKNPNLSEKDVANLMQLTSSFLERTIAQQKRNRCIKLAQDLNALDPTTASYASERNQLSSKLAEEMITGRQYDENKKPERIRAFQVFEYLSNMQIRGKQIAIIENILDGKVNGQEREFIAQLIMGGGKSKVILPILAQLMAKGDKCFHLARPKSVIRYPKAIHGACFQ